MHPEEILRALIVLLSLGGLADALYFTFAYYGRIRGARWVPAILCAREGSNCVTVVQTRYARVLGPPNSLFGIVFYLALVGWAVPMPMLALRFPWLIWALLASSGFTVVLGIYLIYALLRKLHTHCPLCYTAHAINTLLFVLLWLLAFPMPGN
jgi:uncharacterized membrane protein